jgi:hypothetical protein
VSVSRRQGNGSRRASRSWTSPVSSPTVTCAASKQALPKCRPSANWTTPEQVQVATTSCAAVKQMDFIARADHCVRKQCRTPADRVGVNYIQSRHLAKPTRHRSRGVIHVSQLLRGSYHSYAYASLTSRHMMLSDAVRSPSVVWERVADIDEVMSNNQQGHGP